MIKIKTGVWLLTLITISLIVIIIYIDHNTQKGYKYFIPEGYSGKLIINYEVKEAEVLKIEDGFKIIRFNKSGVINISDEMIIVKTKDKFIVYSEDNSTRDLMEGELMGGFTEEEEGNIKSIFFAKITK